MKRLILLLICLIAAGTGLAATHYWTNAVNQDFATFGNWNTQQNGSGSTLTTFSGNAMYINIGGSQGAIISADISGLTGSGSVRLGYGTAGANVGGDLYVSGGVNAFDNSLQVGGNTIGQSTLTMVGGTLKFNNSYVTIGEGTTGAVAAKGTVLMSGGTLETDRMTICNNIGTTGTLDISGGNIKIVNYKATTTSGSLRMGSGNATLIIRGTAVVEVEKLTLGNGTGTGIFTMSGGELFTGDVTFATGVVTNFEGGVWTLTGDKTTVIDDAITNGFITHSGGNNLIGVAYNAGSDTTIVSIIPEPATLALLGLGGLLIRKRK